jgi:release factor glutamine methyltransferase
MPTYYDVLSQGRQQLAVFGEDASLEAQLLLSYVSGMSRPLLLASLTDACPDGVEERFGEVLARRLTRYPIQWILGETEFMGRTYQASEEVLIPRSDTEVLVETACELLDRYDYVIECGFGSGIISIELALHRPGCLIDAWDIHPSAVALALRNADRHGVSTIRWHLGDFFESFLLIRRLVKNHRILLVSNPPYIPTADIAELDETVKDFEPHLALDGGSDGLRFYRQLIALVSSFSNSFGVVLEVGIGQAESVAALMADFPGMSVRCVQDLSGINRVVVCERVVTR